MIDVVLEPDEFPKHWPQEMCALCHKKTKYWYRPKDVAVCPECALNASADDVPVKQAWIASNAKLRLQQARW